MKLDTRNPFAAWGFEQEVYAVDVTEETTKETGINNFNEETDKGFQPAANVGVEDNYVNNGQDLAIADADWAKQNPIDASNFDTNDEKMKPVYFNVKRVVPGEDMLVNDKDDNKEYKYNNTELNYYGIQAADLNLNPAEESNTEEGGESDEPTTEPTEPTTEPTEPTTEPTDNTETSEGTVEPVTDEGDE